MKIFNETVGKRSTDKIMVKCEMEVCCLYQKACIAFSLAQGADGAVMCKLRILAIANVL